MNQNFHVDETKIWFRKESGWPDEVPKNFDFPEISLGRMLDDTAAKMPDDRAMWFLDTWMTFSELKKHADSFATALHHRGIKKVDVVALILPNSFQFVIAAYACFKLGAIVTGVNPTYKPVEVKYQLKYTGAKAIITLDSLFEQLVKPIVQEIDIKILIGTNIVDLVKMSSIKKLLGKLLKKIPVAPLPSNAEKFSDLLKVKPDLPEVTINPAEDPALYQMTGGTTGEPKAAILTHFNLVSNADQCGLWLFKAKPGTGLVGVLPLFHSFASTVVMNAGIRLGAWMMLFPRPPDQKILIETINKLPADAGLIYCGAEVLFQKMADFIEQNPQYKEAIANKLSLCVSGAGPLHRPVQEKFEKVTGGKLEEGYGLTETTPVVSACPFYGKRKIGTIGFPFPGTEWKIMDKEDFFKGEKGIGENEVGEICVAGPQVMKGYLNKPEETADTIKEWNGKKWLLTGDIGYMDNDGAVVILDRKKQLIKHKGYSVFPKDVETLIGMHEMVHEVAVAGLPDQASGEIIKAWVVLKPDAKISAEEMREWCKQNMAHYKVPSEIEFRSDLPKTLVGKVLRRTLQEQDPRYRAKL
jgi:long-chain acyl-CoA synthetase